MPDQDPPLAGRKVSIATPLGDGKFVYQYVVALLPSFRLLRDLGAEPELKVMAFASLITQARNEMVADFWRSDATDMVFIDADIGWNPPDLVRLLLHPVPVVAGVYPRKSDKLDFTVAFGDGGRVTRDGKTGLIAADRVGAGFLRMSRAAIGQLREANPDLMYTYKPHGSREQLEACALFDTALTDGRYVGEDFAFCDRWRAIGGTVWVDPEISLQHIGSRTFDASLKQALTPSKPAG
jgi:hypothetical protein